jgi:glycosyltransferase involved in cell wall biosynthesis
VFLQTFRDYEIVIVNDGSPDTPELEQALAPWLDKVVYTRTENQGLAQARNTGIRISRGELIALLDSDDIWEPDYLEVQVRELDQNPSADIVYPRFRTFGEGVNANSQGSESRGEVTFVSLVEETCVVTVSVLARREALERAGLFDTNLRSCEDFDLWLRCVKTGSRIIYHDRVLLHYRRRPGSLSSDPVWMCFYDLKVLKKMRTAVDLTVEEARALEGAIHRFEGRKLFFEAKRDLIAGDVRSAVDRLRRANLYLDNTRIQMILLLLRLMPRLVRKAYLWRLDRRPAIQGINTTKAYELTSR